MKFSRNYQDLPTYALTPLERASRTFGPNHITQALRKHRLEMCSMHAFRTLPALPFSHNNTMEPTVSELKSLLPDSECDHIPSERSATYHIRSVWLFTFSDLKTIVVPKTVFGILNAVSAPLYGIATGESVTTFRVVLGSFWIWINLLPFVIDNQRRPESILEDKLNKPWRPMPSGRMTEDEARRLIFILYPIAFVISIYIGGARSSAALMLLGYWYNNHGGAGGVLSKNFINACGFICFASGAMEVMIGRSLPLSTRLVTWFSIIGLVVFTTVQTQDIPDQAGDALAGRRTVPLVLGDQRTRILTAVAMAAWSWYCPFYWNAPYILYITFLGLGLLIGFRCLWMREVEDDARTFRLWNLWMVVLYATPLVTYL